MKIGIIDSGVRKEHPAFAGKNIQGCSLKYEEGRGVYQVEDFSDQCGHGTAVYNLVEKGVSDAEIFNIKIFEEELEITQDLFEDYLEYILQNFDFDIINLSLGVVYIEDISRLQSICRGFHEKNTLLISAFNNDGALSFPAALNGVIGVDALNYSKGKSKRKMEHVTYDKDSIVNVHCNSSMLRVAWTVPDYNFVVGNSFTCAVITAKIAKALSEGNQESEEYKFAMEMKEVYKENQESKLQKLDFQIQKAVIFPFNKEMHALIRYPEMLNFEITHVYTHRITGNVGKYTTDILRNEQVFKLPIENIDRIDWDDFDTIILGHMEELISVMPKDIRENLLIQIAEKGKNIYSLDPLDRYQDVLGTTKVFVPKVDADNLPKGRYGKLFKTMNPVVLVCGTSSKQGKFTFQLYMRKRLQEVGYSVGQLGTEPTSLLFGMDYVFPSGYNTNVSLSIQDYICAVNEMLYQMSKKQNDIIITGTQSGVLPYNDDNINFYPLMHQLFLQAVQADAIVLCVNCFDELTFVERCIKFVEGLTGAKVVGCVCFPVDYTENHTAKLGARVEISDERKEELKEIYKEKLAMDLCFLGDEEGMDQLISKCIDFFAC